MGSLATSCHSVGQMAAPLLLTLTHQKSRWIASQAVAKRLGDSQICSGNGGCWARFKLAVLVLVWCFTAKREPAEADGCASAVGLCGQMAVPLPGTECPLCGKDLAMDDAEKQYEYEHQHSAPQNTWISMYLAPHAE